MTAVCVVPMLQECVLAEADFVTQILKYASHPPEQPNNPASQHLNS